MKRIITVLLAIIFSFNLYSQERQSTDTAKFISTIPGEKQNLLKNVDMFANTQVGFRSDFHNGEYLGSGFKFEQFRMEIKGYVHKNIFFRFRHRYTSTFEPQSIDKIIKGVDFAYFRFNIAEKWKLTLGKTYADWGGIEFDINPIEIYAYSDIIEMADNFLTGAEIHYKANNNNTFGFQVLNSRTGTFDDIYDTIPNVTASKAPLAFVVNWRGKFFNGKIHTNWSYSVFTEAENNFKNYIALGQQFTSKYIDIAYDYKISMEQIDRTAIISDEIPDNLYNYSVRNTMYQSHWTRITYKMNKKWHFSLDAYVDLADWKDDLDPLKTEDRFRTAYSFIPTIEFFPWDYNLKFFVAYVGRYFQYSDYVKNRKGLEFKDYSTGRVMIGMISPLKFM
jgi:hypothetical protein